MANGLISTQINKEDPVKSVSGYKGKQVSVDPKTDTVEGRVERIIDKDSPLQQQARTRAKQGAQKRGILNSSMAIQAGQAATYDAAVPIASQDAKTSSQFKLSNQGSTNRAREFTAGSQNQAAMQQLAGNQRLEQIGAQTDAEKQLLDKRGEIDMMLQSADAETRERLLSQQGEIDRQIQELRGEQQIGAIGAQTEAESRLLSEKADIDEQMLNADADVRERLMQRQGEIDQQLQELRGEQEIGAIEARGDVEMDLQERRGQIEKELQGIQGEQAMELAQIEQEYNMLMRTSEDAAAALTSTNQAIGNILANPDLKDLQKEQLINRQVDLLRNNMSVIGSIGNVDLEGLITPSGSGQEQGQSEGAAPRQSGSNAISDFERSAIVSAAEAIKDGDPKLASEQLFELMEKTDLNRDQINSFVRQKYGDNFVNSDMWRFLESAYLR